MLKRLALTFAVVLSSVLAPLAAPGALAASTTVVISQFQVAGGTAADEFVELHNVSGDSIDLNGYTLVYRSAAGTTDVTLVNFTASTVVPAGGYFLVAATPGYDESTTADATFGDSGTGRLAGAGGGLALRSGPATTGVIVDSVGFGTATNAFVETVVTLAPAANTSKARLNAGCTDTDNNSSDFELLNPSQPRNSSTSPVTCSVADQAPRVSSITPANGTTHVSQSANITIAFSEAVDVADEWFSLSCATSGSHPATVSGGPATYVLDPADDFATGETCTLTIEADNVTDQDNDDPPDNMASDFTASFTTAIDCSLSYTPIYEIQGTGAASPLAGTSGVRTRGVVVADFQNNSMGYYLRDVTGDANTATSDGVYVYNLPSHVPFIGVNVGDEVIVSGRVTEFQNQTEMDSVTSVAVCSSDNAVPAAIALDLPLPSLADFEAYEGMLVSIPEVMTVDQNYFQGRYGQVTLSAEGRMYNPTNGNGLGDTLEYNQRRMIVLDDAFGGQNPNPIPYIGEDNTLRAGDSVTGLVGVLDEGAINSNTSIRHYRLQPTAAPTITRVNERTAAPEAVGGNARVASFNVLNYFNGDGLGTGFPTSRGATTLIEFNRQRAKIITAMAAIDADVVGLMEIENDAAAAPTSAIADLVSGLNETTGAGAYAYVVPPVPGDDAITVGLIYQPARVTPVGEAQNYQINDDPNYPLALFDRPPLVQTFRDNGTDEVFTVIVNHLKSKGSCPASGPDADQGDGQGCWNAKRTAQAQALVGLVTELQTDTGDPDVLVIGDLNAYGVEDPILALTAGGLVDTVAAHVPAAERYSYVFDGFAGYLDHGLATTSLAAQVADVTYWHINADEPSVIDYNTEFKPQDLYVPTAYRSSDHDPVIIGLQLPHVADLGLALTDGVVRAKAGELLTYTLVVSNAGPAPVVGAVVSDTFPAELLGVAWTCAAGPGGACPASGSGNINATIDLAPGSAVTFTASGTLTATLPGLIANQATITPAAGVVDPNPANNTASDSTVVLVKPIFNRYVHPTGTVIAGTSVALSVEVTGTEPISFQWYEGALGDTTHPVGADSATFITPVLVQNTSYWVRATNEVGSTDSELMAITPTWQVFLTQIGRK